MNGSGLEKLRKEYEAQKYSYKHIICVCGGNSCSSSESDMIYEEMKAEIKRLGLSPDTKVIQTGCCGLCARGPVVTVYPEGITYEHVTEINIEEIIDEHIIKKGHAGHFISQAFDAEKKFPVILKDSEFVRMQNRQLLKDNGQIDPFDIHAYIGSGGFSGLEKALEMKQEEVIAEVAKSGLRGRGGAGFPTAKKWDMAFQTQARRKYLIANADEGDLGAYSDRSMIEGNPFPLLEGMLIAGYAIGADKGYVFTRREYKGVVDKVNYALIKMREYGLLDENILGSGFCFDIELRFNPGAYVNGEETALIRSFEKNRAEPYTKPEFPAVSGIHNSPTVINNAETLYNIPSIIKNGADSYVPTKIIALGGEINNEGIIEVPLGTSLYDIVYTIGGGIKNNRKFKAILTGGASGSCITEEELRLPLDYELFGKKGLKIGGGVLTVLSSDCCIVDQMKRIAEFSMQESCGKCTACRLGTKKMYELLDRMSQGLGSLEELEKLEKLALYVKNNSACGLGTGSAGPILESLSKLKQEYICHVEEKRCPSGVCRDLVDYTVNKDICEGCGI